MQRSGTSARLPTIGRSRSGLVSTRNRSKSVGRVVVRSYLKCWDETADCPILIEHPQGQIGLGHPKASDFDSQSHTQSVGDVDDCVRCRGPT